MSFSLTTLTHSLVHEYCFSSHDYLLILLSTVGVWGIFWATLVLLWKANLSFGNEHFFPLSFSCIEAMRKKHLLLVGCTPDNAIKWSECHLLLVGCTPGNAIKWSVILPLIGSVPERPVGWDQQLILHQLYPVSP